MQCNCCHNEPATVCSSEIIYIAPQPAEGKTLNPGQCGESKTISNFTLVQIQRLRLLRQHLHYITELVKRHATHRRVPKIAEPMIHAEVLYVDQCQLLLHV